MDHTQKLTRVRAGLYRTDDERFTVAQSGGAWYARDDDQTDQLGQPRLAGPYPTLGAARQALATLRSDAGGRRSGAAQAPLTRRSRAGSPDAG